MMRSGLFLLVVSSSEALFFHASSPSHFRRRDRPLNGRTRAAAASNLVDSSLTAATNSGLESEVKDRKRNLDLEFIKIGLPSLVQFTASPLCALVDAIYLGRLGADALGKEKSKVVEPRPRRFFFAIEERFYTSSREIAASSTDSCSF